MLSPAENVDAKGLVPPPAGAAEGEGEQVLGARDGAARLARRAAREKGGGGQDGLRVAARHEKQPLEGRVPSRRPAVHNRRLAQVVQAVRAGNWGVPSVQAVQRAVAAAEAANERMNRPVRVDVVWCAPCQTSGALLDCPRCVEVREQWERRRNSLPATGTEGVETNTSSTCIGMVLAPSSRPPGWMVTPICRTELLRWIQRRRS